MGTKLVQGGILVALVGIAGLLYSIRQQMTPQPAAAPVQSAQTLPAAAPAQSAQTLPAAAQPSGFAPAAGAAPQTALPVPAAAPAAAPAPKRTYQSIPRAPATGARSAPVSPPARPSPPPTYEATDPPVAPPPPVYVPAPASAPPPPATQSVTVPAGTAIAVRLLDGISTERNRAGDPFQASLEEPLVADGVVVAERGATVMGRVVQAQQSGRVSGLAEMALELDRIRTVSGEVQLASDTMIRRAESSKGRDAATVGAMAGVGAAIGAIAGGRKGAGIGAAAGGATGAGTVMATRGKPVQFDPETRLTFRLRAPLTVTVDPSRVRQPSYDDSGRQRPSDDSGRPRLQRRP